MRFVWVHTTSKACGQSSSRLLHNKLQVDQKRRLLSCFRAWDLEAFEACKTTPKLRIGLQALEIDLSSKTKHELWCKAHIRVTTL